MNQRHSNSGFLLARRGFTLLELIISVALVLVLMLAITRIFSITSSAVGASQGLAAATRDARAAQVVFSHDIASMASDSPFIWIRSDAPFSAFRNSADELADRDHLPLTIDVNNDGKEGDTAVPGENIPGFELNARRHRIDCFSFFARDSFARQTGNTVGNVLVSTLTSPEAWIYYGQIALPNNDGQFQTGSGVVTDPGKGNSLSDNPNNYYASQWVLGRFAPLMVARSAATNDVRDRNGVVQECFTQTTGNRMRPFTSTTTSLPAGSVLRSGRYDLLDIDIAGAKTVINTAKMTASPAWYTQILNQHLRVNPFAIKPISAASTSQQVPIFVTSISQFVVEFAGDFVTQDRNGAVTALTPDGVLDYSTIDGSRQIRWYGYPRDADNDGAINVTLRDTNGDGVLDTTGSDVVPVSDFALPTGQLYDDPADPDANPFTKFEHFTITGQKSSKTYSATPNFGTYYAVWDPDSVKSSITPRPLMYRIILSIDRPELAARTLNGVDFEYVFNAP